MKKLSVVKKFCYESRTTLARHHMQRIRVKLEELGFTASTEGHSDSSM